MRNIHQVNINTCFLSPHSDDTLLEAYYLIQERFLPEPYLLCTVFSKSNYVDITKIGKYSESDISSVRKEEDISFAREQNMQYLALDESDCLLRYGTVYYNEQLLDSELIDKLYLRLHEYIERMRIKNIVVPFPFGGKQHYDHRLLAAVARRLGQQTGLSLLWTNDIPYSQVPAEQIGNCIWEKVLTNSEIQHKIFRLNSIYASQASNYYREAIKKYDERLFLV